ncbi:putative solute carrier family 35 member C2 [Podospora conica]|nr:putative solute carrier family 35 member C2 [Schizothecium conicum]
MAAREDHDRDAEQGLVAPEEKPQTQPLAPSVHPIFFIASWIFFSNSTILFNKWIIDNRGFKYPAILTCWHLVFATAATQILSRTTTLLDGRKKVQMTGRVYLRAIVPIGLLYSASLVCSNMVYLYLSVAFIQMLKSAAPVAVLLTAWAWGVEKPSMKRFANVSVIVAGVALASLGEINFSMVGFLFQVGGIVFEAMRLIMIQVLLAGDGQKMDPLVSLYYFAPVCAVMNIFIAGAAEAGHFDFADVAKTGYGILLLNAMVAFMLNVSSIFLVSDVTSTGWQVDANPRVQIGKTSGLVMTLTGILKNILLVIVSVMIWNTSISFLQFVGYGIALAGLVYYSLGWEQIVTVTTAFWTWLRAVWDAPGSDSTRLPSAVRRGLFTGVAAILFIMLVGGFMYGGSYSSAAPVGGVPAAVA